MPKVAVCPNGHHYDADKFSTCPHCGRMNALTSQPTPSVQPAQSVRPTPSVRPAPSVQDPQKEEEPKKRRSFFDASKKHGLFSAQKAPEPQETEDVSFEQEPQAVQAQSMPPVQELNKTVPLYAEEIQKTVPLYAEEIQKTVPLYAEEIQKTVPLYADDVDSDTAPAAPQQEAEQNIQPETPPKPMTDLQKAVQATNSGAVRLDTKTIGFFNIEEDEPPTEQQHAEPTVGWIVCVKGAHKGESFALRSGRNSIGRADNMDVVLRNELTVSRDKHAHIVYDPLNAKFLLQSGDGHGLTYKNGEMVMTFAPLESYDRILLGQAEFVFVAFCGEKFQWT